MKVLWVCLFLAGCASGSAILVGEKRPPRLPDEVVIYMEPPAKFESIAIVKASSGRSWTQQGLLDSAVRELKSQAASLGANGIIFTNTGTKISRITSDGSVHNSQTVEGKAIYVY